MNGYHYYASSDGMKLAYRVVGNGPPLLCLAGLTRNSTDFEYLQNHLGGVSYICPDYRGRGRSEWDSNSGNYNVPVEARDVLELLDHLGIDTLPVIGTSRGGIISMMLASAGCNRFSGIILNDVGAVIESEAIVRIARYVGKRPSARGHDELAEILPSHNPGFSGVPHGRWLEEARKHFPKRDGQLQLSYDPKLRCQFMPRVDKTLLTLWEMFDAIPPLPLLLLRGAGSDLITTDTAREMQNRRPDMTYCPVPGRGHCPFLDEPECLDAIVSFLERLEYADVKRY